ncbi:uncharacterized protein [Malus domestica]|uniref:uncharacterized protein n=1 Tax=Malus domestica TaxID=3750 RepID=UPI0039763670
MVCDLIDSGSNSWKSNIIRAGFHREDADTILSIPLSYFGCDDKKVWHYTANGDYSVKSGYGVAMDLMENGALGKKGRGAPSEQQQRNNVWRRHLRVDNVCGVCNAPDEMENHLFFRCNFSHLFWFCFPPHLNSVELAGVDFLDSWAKFHKCVKDRVNADEICQEFAFGLWRLWKNRNDVVFKGLHRQPLAVLDLWRKNINEFREAADRVDGDVKVKAEGFHPATARTTPHWQRPRFGTIKINTDAAWRKDSRRAGVGWVGRDFAGVLQAAGGSGTILCQSAAAAEVIAIRTALSACIKHGFNHVIVESDAQKIIHMIRKEVSEDFNLDCILGDIKILARMFTSVTFAFVPRESNQAAHLVAKYVLKEGRDFTWDNIGPVFLFNTLAQDVNLLIRL